MTSNSMLVENMAAVWDSIASLCRGLDAAQWGLSTDCPGWSVQDQLSHLTGAESLILGRPKPDHEPQDTSFVRNEIGRRNEVLVDWRRRAAGPAVLQEFQQVTGERMKLLRAMTTEDFEQATETPIGPGIMRDFISIRIFDAWVHEQDMRRALALPGHLDGPVVQHSLDRMFMAMPFVVGKKAQAEDGVTAVFQIAGAAGRTVCIGVENRRANVIDPPMDLLMDSSVVLDMNVETFTCLTCGRWDPERVMEAGQVDINGNLELGRTILSEMNIMI